ncbi:MAG: radical SAM protein [Candidatus Eremiobacteraeota bacterium]|nr:radical SAM protein [Candidatus Eremiobacteraeota bacterium]
MTDIVFINPGDRKSLYQSLGSTLSAIEPPIWTGLLAEFARLKGKRVLIIDANAEGLEPGEAADRAAASGAPLAVIVAYGQNPSASTQVMPSAGAFARALRERAPGVRSLMVGGHVAALPERTLMEEEVDYICGGEGPHTIVALQEALETPSPDFRKVPDLWFREEGKAAFTSPSPLISDLDREMPSLAWDLLPMELYRAHNWHCFGDIPRKPYASLYTTLGCPFHCTYCCIQAPFRNGERAQGMRRGINSYRYWSPEAVIAQIDMLVKRYGVKNIKIADEMFVFNRKHVTGLCDLILERGYDLNIWAYARIDTMKGMAPLLKKAGVNWLCFGIESGSAAVRDDVKKKLDQEQIIRTIEYVRSEGISVIANYLFGLPEDNLERMEETLALALDLNCEFANFYCAMAYPGSQLYETARHEGWPLPSEWSGYSQHAKGTLPLPTRYLTGAEVLAFRDEAFHRYHTNPRYLSMITAKFGAATAEQIMEMASHRLERDHVKEEPLWKKS